MPAARSSHQSPTQAFATCGFTAPPCGSGSRADIQASPRPDASAENLALLLGSGVVAEQALYQRLSTDLAAIRASDPALASAAFRNIWWDPRDLLVLFTPEAFAALQGGTYDEWDCLNAWFGGALENIFTFGRWAHLRFAPLLHPYRVGPAYVALPGVTYTEPNSYAYPAGELIPTPGLCAIADDEAFDYFIEGSVWRYFRVEHTGAAPVLLDTWNGVAPGPTWENRLEQCYRLLEEGAAAPGF